MCGLEYTGLKTVPKTCDRIFSVQTLQKCVKLNILNLIKDLYMQTLNHIGMYNIYDFQFQLQDSTELQNQMLIIFQNFSQLCNCWKKHYDDILGIVQDSMVTTILFSLMCVQYGTSFSGIYLNIYENIFVKGLYKYHHVT